MPSPLEWGPSTWFLLHSIAVSYPDTPTEEHKQSVINFLHNLSKLLPCSVCAHHLQQYLKEHKIEENVNSRDALERFIYDLHEAVNKSKGAAQKHTFEEVQNAFRGEWKGFGGYPFPATKETLEKHKAKVMEKIEEIKQENQLLKARKTINILSVCLIIVAVGAGITGAVLYRQLRNSSIKSKQ